MTLQPIESSGANTSQNMLFDSFPKNNPYTLHTKKEMSPRSKHVYNPQSTKKKQQQETLPYPVESSIMVSVMVSVYTPEA